MLTFREIEPSPALVPFVRSFWTLVGSGAGAPAERILPDGCFDLVFHFGDPFSRGGERQPQAMWVGEPRRPVVITPSVRIDVLGVRFRIGGASSFVRAPLRDLRDAIVPLGDVLGDLDERVLNARTTEQRVAIIEARLLWALSHASSTGDSRTRAAVREIVRRDGDVRIDDLASRIGTTTRTLERLFHAHVGVGPKSLARLMRFQTAVKGGDAAFFDDAHRIHEFRAFSGITPTEFRREQNLMNDAFVGNLQDPPDV